MSALFRGLKWLEPLVDVVRLGCFTTLVLLCLWHLAAVLRHAEEHVLRFRAKLVIAFTAAATIIAGVSQIEAWPFPTWALVHTAHSTAVVSWEIEGIAADGAAYEIDPRVLQPLQTQEFGSWMLARINALAPADRQQVLAFILRRANAERQRFLAGRFPPNDFLLGGASAPAHFTMRHVWRTAANVPHEPFVGVRFWRFDWDLEERARGHGAAKRTLLAEYREQGHR